MVAQDRDQATSGLESLWRRQDLSPGSATESCSEPSALAWVDCRLFGSTKLTQGPEVTPDGDRPGSCCPSRPPARWLVAACGAFGRLSEPSSPYFKTTGS